MTAPVVDIRAAGVSFGSRPLWSGLDLAVRPGEFITVLGPNGSGKSTLLKVILGLLPLTSGEVRIAGRPATRGDTDIGYVPQSRGFASDVPLRGRDLVQLGVDGGRWGLPAPYRHRRRVDQLLGQVEAGHLATRPVGSMSGGEQQRLRIAQALATDPLLLLCDEPLLSLDLRHQQRVVELVDKRRWHHETAVLFVTHEINPVLSVTDRILYMTNGAFTVGTPAEVLRSEVLSALYGAPVEVIHRSGQVVVLGAEVAARAHTEQHHSEYDAARIGTVA